MKQRIVWLLALLLAGLLLLGGCSELESLLEEADTPTDYLPIAAVPEKEITEAPEEEETKAPAPTEAPTKTPEPTETPAEEQTGPIIEPQAIADYIFAHGELPENFITKSEAEALGWDSSRNDVSDVAPGMSIGGDRFGNYEGRLPTAKGRKFFECDCNYTGGKRGAERVIYSSDGHVWYTNDHYETFTELFPSDQ